MLFQDTSFDSFPALMSPLPSQALLLAPQSAGNRRGTKSRHGLADDSKDRALLSGSATDLPGELE